MRPTRILAVTVSAVLGVALGVGAAIALDRQQVEDPLGLDAPMVNQECQQDKAVLVLETSDTANGLGFELASNPDARYLQTANSCGTIWREPGKPTKAYVVYLGPMSTGGACALQLTAQHRGDHVTMLAADSTDLVPCLCHVDRAQMPTLRPGMEQTDLDSVYIRELQEMLISMGRRTDPPTDVYDDETIAEVKEFQQFANRNPNGALLADTWKALQHRGCENP